jgi:hypothetical protein
MLRITFIAVLFLSCPSSVLRADDRFWPLDSYKLSVHGKAARVSGVQGNSTVLDGDSLRKINDSERITSGEAGFIMTAWVNPDLPGGGQQMIAAKNRYSPGERQWGVMIDKDNRFRLYVGQDRRATADRSTLPKPGHWHLLGVVIRPTDAELWVNRKLAGQVKLTKAIPQTKAPLTFGGGDDNGRIWHNFVGALDEIRLVEKSLDAKQMAAAYQPVTATHTIPTQPSTLWSGPALPRTAESEVLDDVTFQVIKKCKPKSDGSHILNFARYGQAAKAPVATSDDFARTWTSSIESDLPMVTSKPCAGVLSTGQRSLVCTTTSDSRGRRSPLTVAVSRHGEETFSRVFVIRHAEFPDGPGESHPRAALSYPYATEQDGRLYVGFSNSGGRGDHNSVEVAVIPITSLNAGDSPEVNSK